MENIDQKQLSEDLDKILNAIGPENRSIQEAAKNKKGTHNIIMGPSGVGKTTLSLLLSDVPIIAQKNEEGDLIFIKQETTNSSSDGYPNSQISNNRLHSQTKTPYFLQYKPNIYLCDNPGYEDSEGKVQEICNSFYIDTVFESLENIRIILVVSEDMIKVSKSKNFLEALHQFSSKFKNIQILKNKISLVISKSDPFKTPQNLQITLQKLLEEKSLNMPPNQDPLKIKELISFLEPNVHLFHKPQQENQMISKNDTLLELQICIEEGEGKGIENPYQYISKVAVNESVQDYCKQLFKLCKVRMLEQIREFIKILNLKGDFVPKDQQQLNSLIAEYYKLNSLQQKSKRAINLVMDKYKSLFQIENSKKISNYLMEMSKNSQNFEKIHDLIKYCILVVQQYYIDDSNQQLDQFVEVLYSQYISARHFKKIFPEQTIEIKEMQDIIISYNSKLENQIKFDIQNLQIVQNSESIPYYTKIIDLLDWQEQNLENYSNSPNLKCQAYQNLGNLQLSNKNLKDAAYSFSQCFCLNQKNYIPSQILIENLVLIYYENPDFIHSVLSNMEEANSKVIQIIRNQFDKKIIQDLQHFQAEMGQKIDNFFDKGLRKIKNRVNIVLKKDISLIESLIILFINIQNLKKLHEEPSADHGIPLFLTIIKKIQLIIEDNKDYPYLKRQISGLNSLLPRNLWEKNNRKLSKLEGIRDEFENLFEKLKQKLISLLQSIQISPQYQQDKLYLLKMLSFVDLLPKNKKALSMKVEIYNSLASFPTTNIEDSAKFYQSSLEIDKNQPEIYEKLAQNLEKQKKWMEASKNYQIIHYYEKSMYCFQKAENKVKSKQNDDEYIEIVKQKSAYLAQIGQFEKATLLLEKLKPKCNFDENILQEINKQISDQYQIFLKGKHPFLNNNQPLFPQTDWNDYQEPNLLIIPDTFLQDNYDIQNTPQ